MSHKMIQEDSNFFIPSELVPSACRAIEKVCPTSFPPSIAEPGPERFQALARRFQWDSESDSAGNIIGVRPIGEHRGVETTLFHPLSSFVRAGSYINMTGKDGEEIQITFSGYTACHLLAEKAAVDGKLAAISASFQCPPADLRSEVGIRLCEIRAILENDGYEDASEETELLAEEGTLRAFLSGELGLGLESKSDILPLEIVHITEDNVDGCGGSAAMSVVIRGCVDANICSRLECELQKTKDRNESWDTEDMITQACDAVFGVGRWAYLGHLLPISPISF